MKKLSPGENSWCFWQKSKAIGTLDEYEHENPLSSIVQDAIRPIYKNPVSRRLTQNNNESLSSVIWSMVKKSSNGARIVEISSYVAVSTFSDAYQSILSMMNYTQCCDIAEIRTQENTKDDRQARRSYQEDAQDLHSAAEGASYEPFASLNVNKKMTVSSK